jgi:hypothetical protein
VAEYDGIGVYESIQERCESAGWDALTEAERELLCLYGCLALTHSGGLHGFLTLCAPERRALAIRGFERVGAAGGADVVRRAAELFPDVSLSDAKAEGSALNRLTDEFFRVDSWGSCPPGSHVGDGEDASRRADVYAEAHPAEFRGPRTLAEWRQSRFARGAIEPGWRVEALEREAVVDARLTREVCPACGQPMTVYRKTCKRCGRARRPANVTGERAG